MTPQSELETKGNFLTHSFAELVAEIGHSRLNGSLRIEEKEKKCIVYFKSGIIVFAVSNARSARLFDILLRRNKVTPADLAKIPNAANDMELAAFLEDKGLLTKAETSQLFGAQIETILVDALTWPSGRWTFSSLARIRDGLAFQVNTTRLLVDYARCMTTDKVLGRFRSLEESFRRSSVPEINVDLQPDEAFVLSRADDGEMTAADIVRMAAMSEPRALHSIYTLWLAGLLVRDDWQPAFSAGAVAAMKNARLELRTEAKMPYTPAAPVAEQKKGPAPPEPVKEPEVVIELDEYLERVETATTHYDILGVEPTAAIEDLKKAYFSLARAFHPDRYHAEGGDTLRRVQNAFTELAQAHETLKNPETREVYDYRMRKELAEREKREAAGNFDKVSLQVAQAGEYFERGFSLLMDDQAEAALPLLARAVHFAPKNARYHAYYGRALASDEKQRHKAEAEMQTALKLDPNNPTFRILLAEFFIQFNLLKRAEGELTRLLAVFPSNREARDLLDSLKN